MVMIRTKGKIKSSDLKNICKNYDTIKKAALRMVDAGLLTSYVEQGPRLKIIYKMTDKGNRIAELFMDALEVYYGEEYLDGVIPPREERDREGP